MTKIVTAVFEISAWEPTAFPGIEAWLGAVTMRKHYTKGLIGESEGPFLHTGDEANRGYLAIERISGELEDGRRGSFVVHHGAVQSSDHPSAFGYIVPGSGAGDFASWSGSARIEHDEAGAASFVFTLD
jgi:Protein of unknown function (DUF3224)